MITVFYDGECGLCHRTVQFLLQRDPNGALFRYSPLQGSTASELLAPLDELPDSVAILTEDQEVFTRGDAAIHIGHALGGLWSLISVLFSLFPRAVRDWLYNQVAKRRYKIFGTKTEACPLMPKEQRAFFLP